MIDEVPTTCNLRVVTVWNNAPKTVRITFKAGGKQIILTNSSPIQSIKALAYNKTYKWTATLNNKNWRVPPSGSIKMMRGTETIALVLRRV